MRHLFFHAFLTLFLSLTAGAVEWYESTPGGIPGLPIRNGKPSETGWSLSVEKSDEGEKRSLYREGTLESRTVFVRSGGRLVAQDEYDSNGLLVSRQEYAYDYDGNSRGIFINLDPDLLTGAHVETYQGLNPDGAVYRHTSGAAGNWTISDSDNRGRPLKRIVLSDGNVSSETTWLRDDDGSLKEEIQLTGDTELRRRYNSEGRVLEETTITGGSLLLVRSYAWNGANLSRVEERGEGTTTVRELFWTRDKLVSETFSIEGIISSEILYTSDTERTEILYRDGAAAVRVYWAGDTRLREEFLRDGEVVRIREGGL